MYAVVSQVVVQAVGKIIGSSLDSLVATISKRRSLAAKLINLFSCLQELEVSSRTLYNNLLIVANGKEPVTDIAKVPLGRVIVQRSVQDFRGAVNDLSRNLKQVDAIFGIYVREYMVIYKS